MSLSATEIETLLLDGVHFRDSERALVATWKPHEEFIRIKHDGSFSKKVTIDRDALMDLLQADDGGSVCEDEADLASHLLAIWESPGVYGATGP